LTTKFSQRLLNYPVTLRLNDLPNYSFISFLLIPHSEIAIPHLDKPTFLWMTPNGMMSTIIFLEMFDCKT